MTKQLLAVVRCERCSRERRLCLYEGTTTLESAFSVASWLHSEYACGHTPPWERNGVLFVKQDKYYCLLCHGTLYCDQLEGRQASGDIALTRCAFLPASSIALHYRLCRRCLSSNKTLCHQHLFDQLQCAPCVSDIVERLVALLAVFDQRDCLFLIGFNMLLLRQQDANFLINSSS